LTTVQNLYADIPSITVNGAPGLGPQGTGAPVVTWEVPAQTTNPYGGSVSLSPHGAETFGNPALGPAGKAKLSRVLFNPNASLEAKAYELGQTLQQGGYVLVSLGVLLSQYRGGQSVGEYLGQMVAHELGHPLGLEDAYLTNGPAVTAFLPPYDLMANTRAPGNTFALTSLITL
jgi:hypothetical protein